MKYYMDFPNPGFKFRLTKFWMQTNLVKSFNWDKYNDASLHELGGASLDVCGSGYGLGCGYGCGCGGAWLGVGDDTPVEA